MSLAYQDWFNVVVTVRRAFTAAICYETVKTVKVIESDIHMA